MKHKISHTLLTFLAALIAAGCGPILGGSKQEIRSQSTDIPTDPEGQPPVTNLNNLKPVFQISRHEEQKNRIRLNLSGVIDPVTEKPIEFTANQSVFITEDGRLQGVKVSQSEATNQLPYDIVFLVDNSGSMGEEADAVADEITQFSTLLANSGLDVRLGVVGYDGHVNGAIKLASTTEISDYLNRKENGYVKIGTQRTQGYSGLDSENLSNEATSLNQDSKIQSSDENGVVALRYAESIFSWRPQAQKIFINFTDEGVLEVDKTTRQGRLGWHGHTDYTVENFCKTWKPEIGIVHTVWSGGTLGDGTLAHFNEDPSELSKCTGGTHVVVDGSASDLDLKNINTTVALTSSALVEYISDSDADEHEITVTIKNGDTSDGVTKVTVSYAQTSAEPNPEEASKTTSTKGASNE